ncbi:MAG: hypothetical protein ABI640_08520 [Gammaproteobacteria bacterium]
MRYLLWTAALAAVVPAAFARAYLDSFRDEAVPPTLPDRPSRGATLSSYWINFARTGDPNGAGLSTTSAGRG